MDATAAEPSPPPAKLLTRLELAAAMNVHPITVSKWQDNGMPIAERGRRGKPSLYNEVAVRTWYEAREAAALSVQSVSLEDARIRKELSQAKLNEQRLDVQQRRLLNADEVEKAWAREVAAVRTIILASYTTHADRVHRAGTLDGLAGIERELKTLAHEVLRELADPKRAPKAPRAKKSTEAAVA